MNTVPSEIYETILYEMNPDDIINACMTNKNYVKLCKNILQKRIPINLPEK
jgi:hypothetical protein